MAVAFDAIPSNAPSRAFTVGAGETTLDLTTLTVGSGSNRALVAVVFFAHSATTISDISWDATGTPQSLTQVSTKAGPAGNPTSQIWALVNPTSGNKTLRLTGSAFADMVGLSAVCFTGVDQTGGATSFIAATGTNGTSNSPSITVTSAAGNFTVGHNCTWDTGTSAGTESGGATTIYYDDVHNGQEAHYKTGAATVTYTWPMDASDVWACTGVNIVAAGSGGGTTGVMWLF